MSTSFKFQPEYQYKKRSVWFELQLGAKNSCAKIKQCLKQSKIYLKLECFLCVPTPLLRHPLYATLFFILPLTPPHINLNYHPSSTFSQLPWIFHSHFIGADAPNRVHQLSFFLTFPVSPSLDCPTPILLPNPPPLHIPHPPLDPHLQALSIKSVFHSQPLLSLHTFSFTSPPSPYLTLFYFSHLLSPFSFKIPAYPYPTTQK